MRCCADSLAISGLTARLVKSASRERERSSDREDKGAMVSRKEIVYIEEGVGRKIGAPF
jgi:hypothetical protein